MVLYYFIDLKWSSLMARICFLRFIFIVLNMMFCINALSLPKEFTYLKNVDPTIIQEMRYAGYHNFIGRPIKGYEKPVCILTKQAARALKNVQKDLLKRHLSLKVYDCYRPQIAVNDFFHWSQHSKNRRMKKEFYPREPKHTLFENGYIAEKSGHTRGSTVDLTIVQLPKKKSAHYRWGQHLVACYAPVNKRFKDNSMDMGTGFDCLDRTAHARYPYLSRKIYARRMLLRHTMIRHGFVPYNGEWWHFTYYNEPFKKTYFNFPVR